MVITTELSRDHRTYAGSVDEIDRNIPREFRDNMFAIPIQRSCDGESEFCWEVPLDEIEPATDWTVVYRPYLDPA